MPRQDMLQWPCVRKTTFPMRSHTGRKCSCTPPVIAYRPEAGSLVLFPILQGRNGGCLCENRFQDPNPRPSEGGGRPKAITHGPLWSRSLARSLGNFISVGVGWRRAKSEHSARDGSRALSAAVTSGVLEGPCGGVRPRNRGRGSRTWRGPPRPRCVLRLKWETAPLELFWRVPFVAFSAKLGT